MYHLTEEQATTLAFIVNHDLNHVGVPSMAQLAKYSKVNVNTATKRKRVLIEKGYLSPNIDRGKGGYEIKHSFFCTKRKTARFLLAYTKLKKDGFVDEKRLLKETTDSVFDGIRAHAVSTLSLCLVKSDDNIEHGYLSRSHEGDTQIENEPCLADHYDYLLLIREEK